MPAHSHQDLRRERGLLFEAITTGLALARFARGNTRIPREAFDQLRPCPEARDKLKLFAAAELCHHPRSPHR